jgi:RNA-directed DNA polymerase
VPASTIEDHHGMSIGSDLIADLAEMVVHGEGVADRHDQRRRSARRRADRAIETQPTREQVNILNAALRGHYAYYGIAGNFRSLQKVHRAVERYWHKMLCSRSWAGRITWDMFHQIKQRQPILRPKLYLPYRELQALAEL